MSEHRFAPTEPLVLVKAVALGFAVVQVIALGFQIGHQVSSSFPDHTSWLLAAVAVTLTTQAAYAYARRATADASRILRSRRFDLAALLVFGAICAICLFGTTFPFYELLFEHIDPTASALLWSSAVVLPAAYFIRSSRRRAFANEQPHFLDDREISSREEDALDIAERATRFANQVCSADSSVTFGIDAPWGTGKTSFVNLCALRWREAGRLVYRFEPLRYTEDSNLVERFLSDLIAEIRKDYFIPELRPTLARYAQAVKGKAEVGLPGMKLSFEGGAPTVDDVLSDLTFELNRVAAKIIVVIDDLDRLGAATVKKVLFAVKRTFNVPNVTYVLCYDTEMLVRSAADRSDSVAAREFLEKFVGVKVALFVSTEKLTAYMRERIKNALTEDLSLKPEAVFALMGVITAIAEAYRADNGWRYRALLGDIRKVKRLVNVLLLLRLGDVDFEKVDFDKRDLLNLLLLYLTYPGRFRDIYSNESDGRTGTYAIKRTYGAGGYVYTSHERLTTELAASTDDEAFLLRQLFDPETVGLDNKFRGDDEELVARTRACFNYEHQRNLERYLKLIVELQAPAPEASLAFYVGLFEHLESGAATIDATIGELSTADGEKNLSEFWRVVGTRAHRLSADVAAQLIRYLVENIPSYSLLELQMPAIGIRDEVAKILLQILDGAGWYDERGSRRNNTPENVARIASWIFDEPLGDQRGIACALTSESRGVLGLFDALVFRLYCNPGRSSLFNLSASLIRRWDSNARTDGAVTDLNRKAVREISQLIFRVFRGRYIEQSRNIFDDVMMLGLDELAPAFVSQVESQLTEHPHAEASAQLDRARRRVVGFVTYQLSNTRLNDSDCGCGIFDEDGTNDRGGIAKAMNEYVLRVCFNPTLSDRNGDHFADYMLSDLDVVTPGTAGRPTAASLVHGFEKNALAAYWEANKTLLLPLAQKEKRVVTANYVGSYREHLPLVFEVLDGISAEVQQGRT